MLGYTFPPNFMHMHTCACDTHQTHTHTYYPDQKIAMVGGRYQNIYIEYINQGRVVANQNMKYINIKS